MDIRLHTREAGAGPVLVLLHGNGEDSGYFQHQIDYFSQWYHVIAIDSRGHGGSPRGGHPCTLQRFAQDLKDFLDERGLGRISLLGFSDGANVALLFALAHPEYLVKLVLNGANLNPGGVKPSVQWPIYLGYGLLSLICLVDKKALLKKEILGLMVREPHIQPGQLEELTVPTLVIAGDRDMIRDRHTKEIAAHLPHSQLVILSGDHFIAQKRPAAFNQQVAAFLGAANSY